jgi:hypothetical protein
MSIKLEDVCPCGIWTIDHEQFTTCPICKENLSKRGLNYGNSKNDSDNNEDEMYDIGEECLKNSETVCTGACGHKFHKSCIDQWISVGTSTCPMCNVAWELKDASRIDQT